MRAKEPIEGKVALRDRNGGSGFVVRARTASRPIGLFAVSVIAMTVVVFSLIRSMGMRDYLLATDFRALYTGGRMLLGGVGAKFYDLETQYLWQREFAPELTALSQLMPFPYPPFAALPLLPLAALPLPAAYMTWVLLNTALLVQLYRLLISAIGSADRKVRLRVLAVCLSFAPVWITIMQGQFSLILTLSFLASWHALSCSRDLQAGLWLALLLVRPQLVAAPGLALVWRHRWRALAGLAMGSLVLLIVSMLIVGWHGLESYVSLLRSALTWGDAFTMHPQRMYTWRGFLNLLLGTDSTKEVLFWWLAGVLIAVGLLFWGWRGRWAAPSSRFDLQWSLLVLATIFVSPHTNYHDLSLFLIPGILIVRVLAAQSSAVPALRWLLATALLGYFTVLLPPLMVFEMRLQTSVLFMGFALVVLAVTLAVAHRRVSAKIGD